MALRKQTKFKGMDADYYKYQGCKSTSNGSTDLVFALYGSEETRQEEKDSEEIRDGVNILHVQHHISLTEEEHEVFSKMVADFAYEVAKTREFFEDSEDI